jgi:hypothetical protein
MLYEDFQRARQAAVEMTDRFYDSRADDPRRGELWDAVVRQTETARQLLVLYLQAEAESVVQPITAFSSALTDRGSRNLLQSVKADQALN